MGGRSQAGGEERPTGTYRCPSGPSRQEPPFRQGLAAWAEQGRCSASRERQPQRAVSEAASDTRVVSPASSGAGAWAKDDSEVQPPDRLQSVEGQSSTPTWDTATPSAASSCRSDVSVS